MRTGVQFQEHYIPLLFVCAIYILDNEVEAESSSEQEGGERVIQSNDIRVYTSLILVLLVAFISFLYCQSFSVPRIGDPG